MFSKPTFRLFTLIYAGPTLIKMVFRNIMRVRPRSILFENVSWLQRVNQYQTRGKIHQTIMTKVLSVKAITYEISLTYGNHVLKDKSRKAPCQFVQITIDPEVIFPNHRSEG